MWASMRTGVTGGLLLCFSLPSAAHYLWLEPSGSEVRLHFGEAESLLKERSPGRLDTFNAPEAFVASRQNDAPTAAQVKKKADGFDIARAFTSSTVVVKDESTPVRDLTKYDLGFAKSNYYARYGDAAANQLPLDVQRLGEATLLVSYKGKPLPHAKVEVVAPNTWMQEHKTDESGRVTVNLPWRGQYVVHVLHVEKVKGEFAGAAYTAVRNNLAYTFSTDTGSDPGPAIAPRHD